MSALRVPEAAVRGWKCAACDCELAYREVAMEYLGGLFHVELLACQHCGNVLIPEQLAQGKMHQVELLLEDK